MSKCYRILFFISAITLFNVRQNFLHTIKKFFLYKLFEKNRDSFLINEKEFYLKRKE
jgi:hypothetical protein